ncbi:hypothetical protein [Absidia glauca]|uniref:Uncharacterized protein n=1 Tax=Absidia glauca TaxID=4829 RepID=A0A163JAL2_ABSGL|nr:hypothetical protein [Absidia glauca]
MIPPLFLLTIKRSWHSHGRSALTQYSTLARSIGWEPWEDKIMTDYITTNGTRWVDLVQHCLPHKSTNGCKMRWQTVLKPNLKRGPLSPSEVSLLRKGVDEFGLGRWTDIVEKYLPNRSPYQIHTAWKASADPVLVKHKRWTADEDAKLMAGVAEYGVRRWMKIRLKYLPHRSHPAIRARYLDYLDPNRRTTEWTADEMAILLRRTVLYGVVDWAKIAEGLEGRTIKQCKSTYLKHLDSTRPRRGMAWTSSDVKLFWELVRIHGGSWKEIGKHLSRTDHECLVLFNTTLKDELKILYPADVVKQQPDESRPAWKRRIGELMVNHLAHRVRGRLDTNRSLVLTTPKDPDSSNKLGKRKQRWTEEESERLEALVKEHGTRWDIVALHHGTKSAEQCGNRYRNVLRYGQGGSSSSDDDDSTTYIHNQPLTETEKELIIQGVDMFGHNWTAISKTYLPQRKPHQCRRWYLANIGNTQQQHRQDGNDDDNDNDDDPTTSILAPSAAQGLSTGKGRWTEEENERLRFAMDEYTTDKDHTDWAKVARLVATGRTPYQCRQRWETSLSHSIGKRGPWDWNEKMQLVELVQAKHMAENNGNIDMSKKSAWEDIAKTLNTGRSAWSCRNKYDYMVRTGTLFKS